MARKPSLREQLDALLDQLAPTLRDAFLSATASISNKVILADLIAAIELATATGNYAPVVETLNVSEAALRPVTKALAEIFEQAGNLVGNSFPRLRSNGVPRAQFYFDVRAPRAEKFLREQSSKMVTRIQEDVRVNIMTTLQQGVANGTNPRTTGLDIVGRINPATGRREGGIIGLTQPQELWVRNARKDLQTLDERYFTRTSRDKRFDGVVRKAIDSKTPLDASTIDKLISRYKDTLLKLRGETIGRTETINSLNQSEYEAIKQAVDIGAANSSDIQRVWDTAGDLRVRHTHAEMDGQTVGLDEPFVTPDGERLMYPGDTSLGADASETINCRCRVRLEVDFFSE